MVKYIFGIVMVVLGIAMILKTDFFYGLTGAIDWAETHLGGGGTRVFLKLLGLGFIIISVLLMSGSLTGAARSVLVPSIPTQ